MALSSENRYIDTDEFTRQGLTRQGSTPLRQFQRLLAGQPEQDDDALVHWTIQGRLDRLDQPWLDLSVRAEPRVTCQRCMAPMTYPVQATTQLKVVATEADLDTPDDPDAAPEDWMEPVLASRRLDVLELVEDELILGLPYVPMHVQCDSGLPQSQDDPDSDGPESPFKALSQLKKN